MYLPVVGVKPLTTGIISQHSSTLSYQLTLGDRGGTLQNLNMFKNQGKKKHDCDILYFLKYFNEPETHQQDRLFTVITNPEYKPRYQPPS